MRRASRWKGWVGPAIAGEGAPPMESQCGGQLEHPPVGSTPPQGAMNEGSLDGGGFAAFR
jgi:hypothetical protein